MGRLTYRQLLSVGNLTKDYGKFPALRDVSFQIQEGSTTLLLGPNGAGKTTLIRCVLGLLNFDGEIRVGELDVRGEGKLVRTKIGYVPQNCSYYDHLRLYDKASLVAKMK